jgi:DNA-binding NtrC family response regulator
VEILETNGYAIETVETANLALELLEQNSFDVILLDFMMPGMSGIDALSEIIRRDPKVKVIMITAFATIENAVNAIKRGASDFITKPFKIEELLMLIKQVLEEARFEQGINKLELDETLSSLSNPIRRSIIRMLQTGHRMRLMQITREIGVQDHTKVIFHLKSLKESKIINQTEDKLYGLTSEGEKMMECLIILENYLAESAPLNFM